MQGRDERWLYRVASDQHGVFSRAQAVEARLSKGTVGRRLRAGRWERVLPGVYRVPGAPRSWEARVRAVSLWAGPGAAVSHRTAAALWGLVRFSGGGAIHVTLRRRARAPASVHAHRALDPTADSTFRGGVRITSVLRTLLDLAATESGADVKASVDQALRERLTTLEALASFLARHPGHRGTGVLRHLVHELEGGNGPTESELEAKVLELLADAGMPRPQVQVHRSAGRRRCRVDFLFPGSRVIIEADGYAYHSSPAMFERDRDRLRRLAARGYRVLPWTWKALHERPEELVDELSMALQLRAA